MIDNAMPSEPGARFPRRRFLVAALATATAAITSCSAGSHPPQQPQGRGRSWGVFTPTVTGTGESTITSTDRLASLAGYKPNFVHLFAAIPDSLPVATLDLIRGSGATPILTLEPWDPSKGRDQSSFSLATIAAGQHDSDLSRWAAQLAAWPHPVLLRFAQEMNGTWYPWSIGTSQNTPYDYRAAWSRMHSIIRDKAPHVQFVWAPNAITEGTRDFTDCYPGDGVVDYLGLDGYNWGQSPGHQWQSAHKLFSESLKALGKLSSNRPTLITEVGCADGTTPNLKAEWITDFFRVIESAPNVLGFIWFQMDKERDWRFNSSPTSTESFRSGLARWMSSGPPG
ncbi:glycosyl hydrolase [Gordonia alkanivorans]|uniref:glycoside hydrolase family 26 protein n=1 Tax=Gordonia alkanivorans TaxID=84096 RepID=UPI0024B6DCC3|nr:glycosyl hydrolase [Gordonia alkanivorans]MDJ0029626.1 glycosyl hydrolase [Gordonia alkanivorans]